MIEGQWVWGVHRHRFPVLPQPRSCTALTDLPSLFCPGSSRTDRMGSACIKVTKYFLFLFNLLFFVSMTGTVQLPRKETVFLGTSQSKTFQPGAGGGVWRGWGLRQIVGNGSRWWWKEIPSVPSWHGGRTLGPCPSLSLSRSSAEATGRSGWEVGVGRVASSLSGPDSASSSSSPEESACGGSGSQLPHHTPTHMVRGVPHCSELPEGG